MTKIKMFWWNEKPNFGDALNPYLVEKLSDQEVVWSALESADIVGAGSLLQWVTNVQESLTHPLYVWGSGYIFDEEPAISSPLVMHQAVRGIKSLAYGKLNNVTLGDSGLLADMLIDKPVTQKYAIGIVPHLWHLDESALQKVLKQYPNIRLIDVRLNPLEVIKQIAECDFIYSSSLHGLIVADSFGIPNQWLQFDVPLFGGDWKFQDYYSVFNIEPKPFSLQTDININNLTPTVADNYDRPGLAIIKKGLLDAFPYAHTH